MATYKEIVVFITQDSISAVAYGNSQTMWNISESYGDTITILDNGVAYITCYYDIKVIDISTGKVLKIINETNSSKPLYFWNKIAVSSSNFLFVSSHSSFSSQNHLVSLSKYSLTNSSLLWTQEFQFTFIDKPCLSMDGKYIFIWVATSKKKKKVILIVFIVL